MENSKHYKSNIGRIVKIIAILEAILSVIVAAMLASRIGDKFQICDSFESTSNAWVHCVSTADEIITQAYWIATAWGIGGIVAAIIIYCIGYIACRTDENRCIMQALLQNECK